MTTKNRTLGLLLSLALAAGCNGDSGGGAAPGGGGPAPAGGGSAPAAPGKKDPPAPPVGVRNATAGSAEEDALIAKYEPFFNLPMVKYEWDRNAGDKSVSAEDGGPGFTGEGWETCLEFPTTAWPDAPKGGTLRQFLLDWPATLRLWGENYNESFNYNVTDLCLEGMVGLNPITMKFVPSVATHWKISEDKQTYTFRINPEARWSDGEWLTSADVVATWKLRMDPKCRFPSGPLVYGKFEEPVAKSKYIVEVRCKENNWRNFLYIGSMAIMPAHQISIPGDVYLDRYQNSYTAVSGPYMVKPEDVKMGTGIALTRRKDWWGEKNPANAGSANIDRFEFEVVKDINLAYEKVKKGEIDYFPVFKAQWWAEEIPKLDSVQRGLLLARKVYNDAPIGTSGIAINTKKAPLDDRRVRLALQHLYDRRLMIEKFYYNEYEPLSFYHSGVWANPGNAVHEYDPVRAVELLEEAGWTEVNKELYRVKGGQELRFEILYDSPLSERNLTKFQEDAKKAGVHIVLKQLDPAARWRNLTQKEFELCSTAWGGLSIPNPETSWKGELADSLSNNNVTGFKNPRVDALLKEYDLAYDPAERIRVMREIDALVYEDIPYVLGWYNPAQRFLVWSKVGMPPWGAPKTLDYNDLWYSFWIDPAKEKALEEARRDSSKTLPRGEEKNFFWRAWNAAERRKEKAGR